MRQPARQLGRDIAAANGRRRRVACVRLTWLAYISPLPSPFLKRANRPRVRPWPQRVVDVLVPVALDQAYSYRVPAELELAPGDIVAVPLGAREATGVVWAENVAPNPRLAQPPQGHRATSSTCRRSSPSCANSSTGCRITRLAPRGMVLRMALRMGEHLGPARERVGVRLAGPPPKRMTAARERVLALLADGLVRGKERGRRRRPACRAGVIDGLIDEGTLETLVLPPEPVARAPDPDFRAPDFTPAQRAAADALRATVARRRLSASRCSTASPARARPRSISRRSPRHPRAAGRR